MNIRKITSLTALIAFLLIFLTSIVLYIVPQGRIAYWADWHLWGLSKTQWGYIHINLGFLFILSILLHIYYNWKPILFYLKDKQKTIKIFTKDFNVALAITLIVVIGTFFMVPPFSSILYLSDTIKNEAALKYGEPPFGHAEEAPLNSLLKKMGLDYEESMDKLEKAGIKIDGPDQLFIDIAAANGMSPKKVYDIIRIEEFIGDKKALPEIPASGSGKKTLFQLFSDYQLDSDKILKELQSKGLEINGDKSMKDIASKNNKTSIQLYDMIKEISEKEGK